MRTNASKPKEAAVFTNEGGRAKKITPALELERTVMSCMLFEDEFYEDGETISNRMATLINKVKPEFVAQLAIDARSQGNLRHVPLRLVLGLAAKRWNGTSELIPQVVQRADELSELVSMYWKVNGKNKSLSAQMKKGLATAFTKFDEYALAKYRGLEREVTLRDVMFLVHPAPANRKMAEVYKKLANNQLEGSETWEKKLSSGEDKGEVFTSMIKNKELGALAMLRNLRNMIQANVPDKYIRQGLKEMKVERVLPFRFITAARYAPAFEPELEQAMFKCLEKETKLKGHTKLLVDISGSMSSGVSGKSEMSRMDAAMALAMLLREVCETVEVYAFANDCSAVPPRRGFALRDAIRSAPGFNGGTNLGHAVRSVGNDYDRLIVFTDEQSHDRVPDPRGLAYMINVASNRYGVGYGKWQHVDGFSSAVVDWIQAYEKLTLE